MADSAIASNSSGSSEGDDGPWYTTYLPQVLSDLGLALVVVNPERAVFANEAFERLTGHTIEEISDTGILAKLAAREDDEFIGRARRHPGGDGRSWSYETELPHKDGHRVPVEVSAESVERGSEREVIAILRDLREVKRVESELAVRAAQQAAVAELGRRALGHSDLVSLADSVIATVVATLQVDIANVLELRPGSNILLLRAGSGCEDGQVGHATVGTGLESLAGYTLLSRHPVVVADVSRESRFTVTSFAKRHAIVTAVSVAIHGSKGPWGVLAVAHKTLRPFTADDISFLQACANTLGEAIRRLQAEEELRNAHSTELRLRRRVETHARTVIEAQEGERRRIARELHDEIGQNLTGLKLMLENYERLAPEETADQLARARALVADLLQQVHDLSLELRPALLDDLGLRPSLLWLVERFSTQTGIEVVLDCAAVTRRLRPAVETAAYRIVQEALTNVARHARVNAARVVCVMSHESLSVEITDAGAGFDPEALRPGQGSGLIGMEERARSTGGTFEVVSAPRHGTRVMAELRLTAIRKRET